MAASDRWQEVERLFYAALSYDPVHRRELLSHECTDPDILAEVISLLDAHEKGASTFDRSPNTLAADFLEEIEERPDPLIGSSFVHYQVIKLLGQGGMGRVYLAQDSRLGRKVALKVLPSSQVRSMDGLRRFAQEARLASALNHPNIITVYDYGEALSSYYIAAEYVEGPTLRALINQDLDMEKALDISIQIANALVVAHRSGVIHRDIKPENIIVRADGLVKVLDFGLAKSASGRDSTNGFLDTPETIPGAIMGTFSYMSPEQARGQQLDARTDVFSFGIVLFEMLAGSRPFEGESLLDLLDSLVRKDAPALSTLVPEIPVDLEAITTKALAKDLDSRYQTFEALLADLTSVKRRLDAGEKLEPASQRATNAAGPPRLDQGADKKAAVASESPINSGESHSAAASNSTIAGARAGPKRLPYYAVIAVLLIVGAGFYSALKNLWPFERKSASYQSPVASSPRPITNSKPDSIAAVAVSKDGKDFAYAEQNEIRIISMPAPGQEREELVRSPLQRKNCSGLTFSNDGSYLYWVEGTADSETHDLYRIPVSGDGAPVKVKDDVSKSISFSPEGGRFVFVRNSQHALMTANADGSDERLLKVLDDDGAVWLYPAWSPDDKLIACGVMNQKKPGQRIDVLAVGDGSIKSFGKSWATVLNLAWMADAQAIIASAAEDDAHAPGLFYISYPEGKETKLTNDPYGYYGASLAPGPGTLVSVRQSLNARLYVATGKASDPPTEIHLGFSSAYGSTGLSWAPDGTIVYNAGPAQRRKLYEIDPVGGAEPSERPLTGDDGSDTSPIVTPDNRYIVFSSERSGKLEIWRIDRDGANPQRLAEDGVKPGGLLDGKWVVYQVATGDRIRLWKVAISGGTPEPLTDPEVNAENAAVSPDGKRVAFLLTPSEAGPGARPHIALIEYGKILPERYAVADSVSQPLIRWRGNDTLVYTDEAGTSIGIWQQRLERGPGGGKADAPGARPYDLTHPEFRCIFNFDWSPDGRIVLSAGSTPSVEVYELTLSTRSW